MPIFRSRLAKPCRARRPAAKRFALQTLENRLALSAVSWIGPGRGAWDVGTNWSSGTVPGAGDDVTIGTATAANISVLPGDSIAVHSLSTAANDTLSILGGSLSVLAGSTLEGALTMSGGSLTAFGAQASLTANGTTSVSGGSLFAELGGKLSLPSLSKYTSASTLEANGGGSVLNLAGFTTVAHNGPLIVNAENGGEIDFNSLMSLTGSQSPDDVQVTDTGGSKIVAPDLDRLDFVDATVDGTDSTALASWTSFTNGDLNVIGGNISLPGLASLTGSNLNLSGGASLTLTGMTTGTSTEVSLTESADLQTIGDFNNDGTLVVDAGSKLSVGGDFTQSADGTLDIQVAGAPASGQFGQVAVQNGASLNGALHVNFANGYVPQSQDDFRVMTFTSASGNFSSVAGLGSLHANVEQTSIDLKTLPPDVQSPAGVNDNIAMGAGFFGNVATFIDSNPSASSSEFVTAIDWGDGTTGGGNVNTNGSTFQVSGFHDYTRAGSYTVTTTIVVHGVATTVTSTATVVPVLGNQIHVTTSADSHAVNPASSPLDADGNISLRSAIEYVNATAAANDLVQFDGNSVQGQIQLTLGPIEIDASLTIDGGYQLAIDQANSGNSPLFQIDKLDGNQNPVAVTLSNLVLNVGAVPHNNTAAIANTGSLDFNTVNLAMSLGYSPAVGVSVALISGGGQLTDAPELNGAPLSNSDDTTLSGNGNLYPFKASDAGGSVSLSFDADPTIGGMSGNISLGISQPVPASDVVADWRFQEGTPEQAATGAIVDSSSNGLNGTPQDGPVYSSNVPYSTVPQTGQPDKESLALNGTDQQVFVPDSPAFQLTHSLTIEALVYVTPSPRNWQQYIFFRGDNRGGLDPYTLAIDGTGTNLSANFNIWNAAGNSAGISAPLPGLNQWLDIVGTLDDATGTMQLYINGNRLATTSTTVRPFAALDPTQQPGIGIGATQSSGSNFQGLINEVRLCDVALTPDQFLSATPGNIVVSDGSAPLINEPASSVSSLTLDGTNGGDIFTLMSQSPIPITVHGDAGGGPESGSDSLVLPQSGDLSQKFDVASGYSGTWSNGTGPAITFDGIKNLDLQLQTLPTSTVAALPATETTSQFTVSWSGSDPGGPGVAGYDVFASDNGGPFTAFQTDTNATSATFTGTNGHTYGFYSVAIDSDGDRQTTPTSAQATTTVATTTLSAHDQIYTIGSGTITVSAANGLLAGDSGSGQLAVTAGTATGVQGGTFTFNADGSFTYTPATSFAGYDSAQFTVTDAAGNTSTQTVTVLSQHAAVVWKFYESVLDRAPDAAGLQYWTNFFNGGGSPGEMASGFFESDELLDRVIAAYYQQFLLRTPDSAGLAYWVGLWQATGGPEQIKAGFADSSEFFASSGGTPGDWIAALYQRILDRPADPSGETYWLNDYQQQTAAGVDATTVRYQIALAFFDSSEAYANDVTGWFNEYLFRNPTAGEEAQYVNQMLAGASDRTIEQEIANLPEYASNPPAPAAGTAAALSDYYPSSSSSPQSQSVVAAKDAAFATL